MHAEGLRAAFDQAVAIGFVFVHHSYLLVIQKLSAHDGETSGVRLVAVVAGAALCEARGHLYRAAACDQGLYFFNGVFGEGTGRAFTLRRSELRRGARAQPEHTHQQQAFDVRHG